MNHRKRRKSEERVWTVEFLISHTSDAKANRFISPPEIDFEIPGVPIWVFATFSSPSWEWESFWIVDEDKTSTWTHPSQQFLYLFVYIFVLNSFTSSENRLWYKQEYQIILLMISVVFSTQTWIRRCSLTVKLPMKWSSCWTYAEHALSLLIDAFSSFKNTLPSIWRFRRLRPVKTLRRVVFPKNRSISTKWIVSIDR